MIFVDILRELLYYYLQAHKFCWTVPMVYFRERAFELVGTGETRLRLRLKLRSRYTGLSSLLSLGLLLRGCIPLRPSSLTIGDRLGLLDLKAERADKERRGDLVREGVWTLA